MANRAVRTFGYGITGVLLGIYLLLLGGDQALAVASLGLALVSGAGLNVAVGYYGDRFGRRRSMVLFAGTMALSGLVLALAPHFAVALAALLLGSVSPTGSEVGPFLSLEQSMVAEITGPAERARAFAAYNLAAAFAGAAGALASGLPTFLLGAVPASPDPLRPMFLLYAGLGGVAAVLASRLPARVELPAPEEPVRVSDTARRRIVRLSALFAVDSFAGGLILQSFVALWFFLTFPASRAVLGPIFFGAGILTALSYLVAARLGEAVGLLETMVFTHLPANVLLVLLPLAPTFPLALTVYLSRMALAQMDLPTRQAYLAGIVAPDERTAAHAATNTVRSVAHAGGPFSSGALVSVLGLSVPFFLGGGLKIAYDLSLYLTFRRVRPEGEFHEP